jgi:hypothetical protein
MVVGCLGAERRGDRFFALNLRASEACLCADGLVLFPSVLFPSNDEYKCEECHADTYYARDGSCDFCRDLPRMPGLAGSDLCLCCVIAR